MNRARRVKFNWFFLALLLISAELIVCPAQKTSPAKNEQVLSEVIQLIEKNDFANAEVVLKKVLASQTRNATAQTLAGIVAEKQNKLNEAEKHFALAARLSPNSPETRNNYGAILFRLERKAEAAREFEASLKTNPNQPTALINLAQIHFAGNNFSAAQKFFEKAFILAPDAEIAYALVVVALKLNAPQQAAADYRKYAPLAKDVPGQTRMQLGAALLESGLAAEAAKELQAVAAIDQNNVETLVALSKAFLKQKDIKSAGRTLESAVARGLDDARVYAALADVYETGGYLENAIPAMRLAIEKDPKNEFYRVRYGMLLTDSKAPAAAIIRLQEAAKEFPNSAKILLALGIAQQTDGKGAESEVSFRRALGIEPNSVPILVYLALVMDEKGESAETISLTERALAIEEKNAVLHYLLADTLLKNPSADAARIEKHLKRAVQLDPTLTQAHLSLGRFFTRDNRWAEAAAEFEQAVKLAPDLAEAQYQLGRALSRLKRGEEAKAAFEKFKQLNESQTAQRETTRKELVRRLANTRF